MSLFTRRFKTVTKIVTTLAVVLNVYIYTYPLLHSGQCSWPGVDHEVPVPSEVSSIWYLGDLLTHYASLYTAPAATEMRMLAFGDPQINGNWPVTPYIKRLDNFGNDYYLGHIYSVMKDRLRPTHVAVMGDLFSLQWIGDLEFYNRTLRYLTRLFRQPKEYTQAEMDWVRKHEDEDWVAFLDKRKATPLEELLFNHSNVYQWTDPLLRAFNGEPLFINITGNHDIGYAGDATWQHMARYHRLFGNDNFWIEYDRETDHPWRIVVLNDLLLEGPALQEEFRTYTWEFLRQLEAQQFNGSTVLLTHIPFYKREGLCVDGPEHVWYDEESSKREPYKLNTLRSQNHIGYDETQKVLLMVFGNDKGGIIVTGHDHEGCENWYAKEDGVWTASKNKTQGAIFEATVRAMMGDYGGNSGLVYGKFDNGRWEYTYLVCPFAVQHVWWVAKVASLVSVLLCGVVGLNVLPE